MASAESSRTMPLACDEKSDSISAEVGSSTASNDAVGDANLQEASAKPDEHEESQSDDDDEEESEVNFDEAQLKKQQKISSCRAVC
jgi:hypothetical protein